MTHREALWTYDNGNGTLVRFFGPEAEEFTIIGDDEVSDEELSAMSDLDNVEGWSVS